MLPFLMYANDDDTGLLQSCQFDVNPAGRVKVNLKRVTSSNMLLSSESEDYHPKVRIVLKVITK